MGCCGLLPGTLQHADQHASYQLSTLLWVVGGKRTKVLGCHESVPSGHIAVSHSDVRGVTTRVVASIVGWAGCFAGKEFVWSP